MLPPNPVNGVIEIWCQSDFAVKCYRLTARQARPGVSVYDLEAHAVHDGWTTLADLVGDLGYRVWPSLEDYCQDAVKGNTPRGKCSSWELIEVLASLGVDVDELRPPDRAKCCQVAELRGVYRTQCCLPLEHKGKCFQVWNKDPVRWCGEQWSKYEDGYSPPK